jgi:dUTP pyrophosphatase
VLVVPGRGRVGGVGHRAQPTIPIGIGGDKVPPVSDRVPQPEPESAPGSGLPVAIVRLDRGLPLPSYAHPGDAGADLMTTVDLTLAPGERALVPTGISLALPEGYVAFVHPRSGLAARHGLSIVNTPGTVDAGYRGEISVLLVNHDPALPVSLHRGDRIAQLVIQRVERAVFTEVDALPESVRGSGGYGSTGGSAGLGEPTADHS